MSIQSIFLSQVSGPQLAELPSAGDSAVVSLEDRLLQSFAGSAVETEQRAATIEGMLKRKDITNPEVLAVLQQRSGEYAVDVSMINAMVRKGVSTVETLLRSS